MLAAPDGEEVCAWHADDDLVTMLARRNAEVERLRADAERYREALKAIVQVDKGDDDAVMAARRMGEIAREALP
jgi:hypothetical protein